MQTKEGLRLIHNVTATVRDEYGNITHRQESHNTITKGDPDTQDNGLIKVLSNLTGIETYYDSTQPINKMQLGTGTRSSGDEGLGLAIPITATKKVFDTKIGVDWGTTYTSPKVRLTCIWGASYGALSGITEIGLFSDGGADTEAIFAYNTFTPALAKTAGGTLTIDWEVQVAE